MFKLILYTCCVLDSASTAQDPISPAAIFKRGVLYKGIYCPTLTNSFRESRLELSYQRYSHRQRQKSLIIVNFVDILMKTILACMYLNVYNFHFVEVYILIYIYN